MDHHVDLFLIFLSKFIYFLKKKKVSMVKKFYLKLKKKNISKFNLG